MQELFARSLLYTPATRPERFAEAVSCGLDVVAVDLGDSVAPGDKAAARRNASAWLAAPKTGGAARAGGSDG
jgi:citrate lyase beta subunit